VENSVDTVENLDFQGFFKPQKFFACGKLFKKACQVFFLFFSNSTICTNRQNSISKISYTQILQTKCELIGLDAEVVIWFSSAYICTPESQSAAKKHTLNKNEI